MNCCDILREKNRVQAKLAEESPSIHKYLEKSHQEAQRIAEEYGFSIRYAEIPKVIVGQGEYLPKAKSSS
ncbi:hypothetical protein [Methylomagnum sp.]